ncbi:MAG: RNA polymerase factor sigma-54 [Sporomusaceae bacterium]|jgi:RNA polymerase sigma-54 factor|nr:RNA polymerase factor sigma-54 [Sporomusaceae bacterium]
MQMKHSLKLETSQKLIITPELCQAIAILQMSSQELTDVLEKELGENPVLEIGGEDGPAEHSMEENYDYKTSAANLNKINYEDWAEYFAGGTPLNKTGDFAWDKSKNTPDIFTAKPVTLHEHLEFQFHLTNPSQEDIIIGEFLIGSIDDNGYLTTTVEEAGEVLKKSAEKVTNVLLNIQTFDPPGVGARSLKECLKIQLAQIKIFPSWRLYYLGKEIIENYLEQVGAGKLKLVAEKLSATVQEVQRSVDLIRGFEPKPGRAFNNSKPSYIQSDVIIEKTHDGDFQVSINEKNIPLISINSYYRQIIQNTDVEADAKKFIEGKLNSAVHLMKSIEQRRKTLINVTETIVKLQKEFFERGFKYLQPMVMKQVADAIGIHESTVSRAVANKYAATAHGLLPLNFFFSAALQGADGTTVSASRIKRDILELVAAENTKEPLSDSELSDILTQNGAHISRRTVAKYRKELSIPASYLRKRY